MAADDLKTERWHKKYSSTPLSFWIKMVAIQIHPRARQWKVYISSAMPHNHGYGALVQIMAWCHQATRHYLSQWWHQAIIRVNADPTLINSRAHQWKMTLVHVMDWCSQVKSHYLSQYWPRSLPLYDTTRPQWVNIHKIAAKYWTMVNC